MLYSNIAVQQIKEREQEGLSGRAPAEASRIERLESTTMRSNLTSHLPADLAEVHDVTQARRAEVAWQCLYALPRDAPERTALRAEAEALDAVLEILRNPESTPAEREWVRKRGAEADTAVPATDAWGPCPAAEADALEIEPDGAI